MAENTMTTDLSEKETAERDEAVAVLEKSYPPHEADKENFPPFIKWLAELSVLLPDVAVMPMADDFVETYQNGVSPRDAAHDYLNPPQGE